MNNHHFDYGLDDPSPIDSTGRELPEPPAYELLYEPGDAGFESAQNSGHYGIMYAGDYAWNNQRCTAEAYGEYDRKARAAHRRKTINGKPRRSLKFHTTWMDVGEAVECVREIDSYNRFTDDRVIDVLEACPSNSKFVIGRESSPVIYVWTDLPADVMDLLTLALPDELGAFPNAQSYPTQFTGENILEVENHVPTLVRAWFD